MPKIGDEIKGRHIGKSKWQTYRWCGCPTCGKERWVSLDKGKPRNILCLMCFNKVLRPKGSDNPHWRGGRIRTSDGYIEIYTAPNDFFYTMAIRRGDAYYILEHRIVMAKYLNRCLLAW